MGRRVSYVHAQPSVPTFVCGKIRYPNLGEAKQALRKIRARGIVREREGWGLGDLEAYRCRRCFGAHLGHAR